MSQPAPHHSAASLSQTVVDPGGASNCPSGEADTTSLNDRLFRVGCYNCEGALSAAAYIAVLFEHLDVLFLSETWVSCAEADLLGDALNCYDVDNVQIFQSFAMETPPGAGEGRRRGGTAMICRCDDSFTFAQIECESSRLLGLQISSGGLPVLNVIGCYMPYFSGTFEQLELYRDTCASLDSMMCEIRPAAPIMLLGDFNCALPRLPLAQRPAQWARLHGFNAFSRELQRLLDAHDLVTAEFRFSQSLDYTYERGGYSTHIDHILVPHDFIFSQLQSCHIIQPCVDNLSPHLPLICTLSLTVRRCQKAAGSAFSPARTVLNWSCDVRNDEYRRRLAQLLVLRNPEDLDVEQLDSHLTASIHRAASESGCSRRWKPPKSWWTPAVSAARDRARFWHRLWVESDRPQLTVLHSCFRAARRDYRRARVAAARAKVDDSARLMAAFRRDGNVKQFWRQVERARRGSATPRATLSADDLADHFSLTHRDGDSEGLAAEHETVHKLVDAYRTSALEAPGPSRIISAREVAGLITELNRNAAPGPDGVTADHLIHGSSQTLLDIIALLLSASLAEMRVPYSFRRSTVVPLIKKSSLDPNCPDSYRPISLVSTVSKLLELLLLREIQLSFRPSDLQFGFLQRRGTREATLLVQEAAGHYLLHESPLFVANLDARKCFDRIWHAGILLRAKDYLSRRSWLVLAFWYSDLSARVRFGGSISDAFSVRRGVRQGALLSPCLANIFLRPLIQQLDATGLGAMVCGKHVPVVAYADDLLVMSGNALDLQKLLDSVSEFSVSWRLEFVNPVPSATKSHCFIFGAGLLAQRPEWHLCNQLLTCKEYTEHLGVQLHPNLQGRVHVDARVSRGRGAYFGLSRAGLFSSQLPGPDKAFLWRAIVSPTLLFGCALCPLGPADISRLESWQAATVKAALRLPSRAHHTALLAALHIPKVQETLRRSIIACFRDAFRENHRLRQILVASLATLVLGDASSGHCAPIVRFMFIVCGANMSVLLQVAGGHIPPEIMYTPRPPCGVTDSLSWLLAQNTGEAWALIQMILAPPI